MSGNTQNPFNKDEAPKAEENVTTPENTEVTEPIVDENTGEENTPKTPTEPEVTPEEPKTEEEPKDETPVTPEEPKETPAQKKARVKKEKEEAKKATEKTEAGKDVKITLKEDIYIGSEKVSKGKTITVKSEDLKNFSDTWYTKS